MIVRSAGYNFNKAVFPGIQGGPLMHVIAAKAVCFKEALSDDFKKYQQGIVDNAQALCKGLMDRGIKIVSGGTDNHLMLILCNSVHILRIHTSGCDGRGSQTDTACYKRRLRVCFCV